MENGRHYYSALLTRIFEIAGQQKDPITYLKVALPHLKARNPGAFKFIVWDKSGSSIDELTDEKGFHTL